MRPTRRVLCLAGLAGLAGLAAQAIAQERPPAYDRDRLTQMLRPRNRSRGLTAATGADADAGTTQDGRVSDLKILFPFASAELTPDARRQLDELGYALTSDTLRRFRFEVAGHTDAAGSDAYNDDLSSRRARAVVGYLEQRFGIDPGRLEPRGYGKRQLVEPSAPGSPRNRRVEVVTLR